MNKKSSGRGRRIAPITLVLSAMLLIVSACNNGNAGGSPTPDGGQQQQLIEITALGHTTWFVSGMDAVLDEAKKAGFDLKLERVPEGTEGENLIRTRFATNDKPDILFYQSGISEALGLGVPSEQFVPQDDAAWMEGVYKESWKMASTDGVWYGVPYGGANMGVVLYNKPLFARLNLDIPENMDEFWAVSEAIKQDGKIPVFLSGQDDWTLQLPILLAGATRESEDVLKRIEVNEATIMDWEDRKVGMEFLQETVTRGYANDEVLSATYDDAQQALATGEAGMYHMATWVMEEIVNKYPEYTDDIGAFVMPFRGGGEDLAALWVPNSMYVVKGANQDNAQKFADWFAQPEIQNIFFANQGGIPAYKGVTQTSLTPAELEAKVYLDNGQAIVNVPYTGQYSVDIGLPTLAQELIIRNGKTPEQALEALQREMELTARSKGDPNFR